MRLAHLVSMVMLRQELHRTADPAPVPSPLLRTSRCFFVVVFSVHPNALNESTM